MLVCGTVTQGCYVCQTHNFIEFILLVPKGQCFDGIVNFPTTVEEHPRNNKKSYCDNPPYKRLPINLNKHEICDVSTKEYCLEIALTEFGKARTIDLTICKECMEDYDYYTVFEDENDGYSDSSGVYIAPKLISEIKRLLQVDYSVDMHIKELAYSAEQGNVRAMSSLALAYFNGDGVEQNYEEAAKWFGLAAEKSLEKAKE